MLLKLEAMLAAQPYKLLHTQDMSVHRRIGAYSASKLLKRARDQHKHSYQRLLTG